ncbi:MAG: Sec-independent protein translocase protein TatB [Acetobacteraceae bacterium]|jgi:sec-independent protein translocase protein TatB|nr:Sec-independent protein translocase protein TatB [Acetobacteraceae bacterium]
MFDLAWSEIALILLVALVVIGPKELPNAVRGIADFIRKARRMAGEFQVHVDEMMRETKLDEVKKQIDEVRTGIYDMKRDVERQIDEPGLREAFKDPFADMSGSATSSASTAAPASPPPSAAAPPAPAPAPPPPPPPQVAKGPPAFVPPGTVPPPAAAVQASSRDSV